MLRKIMMLGAALALAMGVQAASVYWAVGLGDAPIHERDDGSVRFKATLLEYQWGRLNDDGSPNIINRRTISRQEAHLRFMQGELSGSKFGDGLDWDTVPSYWLGSSVQGRALYGNLGNFGNLYWDMILVVTAYESGDLNTPIDYLFIDDVVFATPGSDDDLYITPLNGSIGELIASGKASWENSGPGSIPEPTSGLLLLLGAAGLALRRRA